MAAGRGSGSRSRPRLQQLNYAQVIIEVNDKHDTNHLVGLLQKALDERVPGARI